MSKISLKNIESGEYFSNIYKYYINRYLVIKQHKAFLVVVALILFIFNLSIVISIGMMPKLTTQKRYAVNIDSHYNAKNATIHKINASSQDIITKITEFIIKNYVITRESYDYTQLNQQLLLIKNSSSKKVFEDFYNYISSSNPNSSPRIRYKSLNKKIEVLSISHQDEHNAVVIFNSKVIDDSNQMIEYFTWQAVINYSIDKITLNQYPAVKDIKNNISFVVNKYLVKLIKVNNNE
ncbi:VirB8 family type IV secretion system protein [Rickettsia endosymbiont of Cardiosporidium cionae]|uniref:type IV secretion system protein n=1 Tax=Rickettsia endosymbiont of Cardiosporidium cionae TaxID=2777155 RepID=UPI0018962EC7|nr:type IV secretion system protein [Rickettsia endosymbiont of Cardiosporidium cionae]KAF8818898.1 virB8 family protein [Rickettsia endosymbiont of Cardiosporidium cionae]